MKSLVQAGPSGRVPAPPEKRFLIRDRAPMVDLLRNTSVIEHFTGQTLTVENGAELVYKAYAPAIDGTRPLANFLALREAVLGK